MGCYQVKRLAWAFVGLFFFVSTAVAAPTQKPTPYLDPVFQVKPLRPKVKKNTPHPGSEKVYRAKLNLFLPAEM